MRVAVVFIGGDIPGRQLIDGVAEADLCIAADGGVRIARSHGLPLHILIGDLDSASAGDVAWAKAEGAEIIRFSENKDATDLELALEYAESVGVDQIIAIGVEGGRLDHELGNWGVLSRRYAAEVEIRSSSGRATVLQGGRTLILDGEINELISLLPVGGDAVGVTTAGLRWPLDSATLDAGTTRGISNEFIEEQVVVSLDHGALLVIRAEN